MAFTAVNSCGVCGRWTNRNHGWSGYPMHQWVAPSEAQILERMKERRAARLSGKWFD